MIRYIAFCFVLIISLVLGCTKTYAYSNKKIKGKIMGSVTDKTTHLPVSGASIFIPDQKTGAATDEKGFFTIDHISEGKHLVEVSHIGYETILMYVDIQEKTEINFLLIPSVVENNTVVVTGVGKATRLKAVPFQVAQMNRKDLFQSTSLNIIEAMTQKAGVSSLSTGPAIAKPVIRGLGYNRVLTIHDGVRQEGQQWGDEHGIEIDDANISKIEILKGPASLIYGSDAMAGVINIISNTTTPNKKIKLNVGSEYQTNNRFYCMNAAMAASKNGFSWGVNSDYKSAGEYQNKYDGYVFNSSFIQKNVGGNLGYNAGWGFAHLFISNFDLKAGMIEGDRDSLGAFVNTLSNDSDVSINNQTFSRIIHIPNQHISHFKITSDNSVKMGNNRLSVNLAYQNNQRDEFGNPAYPTEQSLALKLQTITYAARLHLKEKSGWKKEIGFNGMAQKNTNRGQENIIPEYHLLDYGVYSYVEKEINHLNLCGGLRYDNRSIGIDDNVKNTSASFPIFDKSFTNFSGSIGITYVPNELWVFKSNMARAFRAPGISELASNGAHEGTNRFEHGNIGLKSETSTQYDASIEFNSKHFNINIAGYLNQFDQFIFYRKLQSFTGLDSVIESDGNTFYAFQFQQQAAKLFGTEVTLEIHPHPLDWLHIENAFSLVRGLFNQSIENNKNMPFIPAPRLLSQCRADFKKVSNTIRNAYLKVEADNVFAQGNAFTAYNTETPTSGYTIINAGVGGTFYNHKGKELLSVALNAQNITDVAYQNHLSRLKYTAVNPVTQRTGVFNMGRNIALKINWPFQFNIK